MRRKTLLFGVIVGALAIGVASSGAVIANKDHKQINAETINNGQLYVQVRDASELSIGDTVIIGHGDLILSVLAGNPIFSQGQNVGGHNEDYSKYYFADSNAIPWKIEAGIAENTYAFKSIKDRNKEKNLSHPTNGRYLTYGHNYSGPGYSNIQAYGDINTSGTKNNYSSWNVRFDDNGYAHMFYSNEQWPWYPGAEDYTEIEYRDSGLRSHFGYYQNNGRIKLYRKVDLYQGVHINVIKPGNTNKYTYGEYTDLTGLEIEVTFVDNNSTCICTYENEPNFFTSLPVSMLGGALFSWCGFESRYAADVNQDTSNERLYSKTTDRFYDPRGEYVLGFDFVDMDEEDMPGQRNCTRVVNVRYLNSTPQMANYATLWNIQNPINDTNYGFDQEPQKINSVTQNLVKIVMIDNDDGEDNNDYYIKVGNNYLFNNSNGYLSLGSLTGEYSHDQTAQINIDSENHVTFGQGNGVLAFDKNNKSIYVVDVMEMDESYIPVDLYRLQLTDNLSLAGDFDAFMNAFYNETANYDASGATKNITSGNWSTLANAFDTLDLNLQGYLGGMTYRHNHETARTVREMVDIYDSILNIYEGENGFYDFMNRKKAGTLRNYNEVTVNATNCEAIGYRELHFGTSYTWNITPNEHFILPDLVEVLMGGVPLSEDVYTYDKNNGTLTINANVIIDNITINITAVMERLTVTYIAGNGAGKDYVIDNLEENSEITLIKFKNSNFLEPAGQRFKCWDINGVHYNPGDTITVDQNIIITAIYEEIPAVDEIENHTYTTPYLSYEYTFDGENYTFSDVIIRFRGIISKTLWDELDTLGVEENEHNILGYGALLSTESYLNGVELRSLYDQVDGVNVKNFYVEGETPTFLEADQYDEISVDSYSWNLRKVVGSTPAKINRTYVALTYVVTEKHGVVFLAQSEASVRSLASEMLNNVADPDTYKDGSLKYLATLSE